MPPKGKTLAWMCCVCLRTSRHPDSVQCERCLACAHCSCAGFRTYAEAQSSNRLFFCKNRSFGGPPPSPVGSPPSSLSKSQYVTPPGSPSLPPPNPSFSSPVSTSPHILAEDTQIQPPSQASPIPIEDNIANDDVIPETQASHPAPVATFLMITIMHLSLH